MTRRIVLLPGMDGTGRLFEDLTSFLPREVHAIILSYPPDRFLRYEELRAMVLGELPTSKPFVLLGESFSAPLAVQIASSKPSNLVGLILSSGFVYRPVGAWTRISEELARPWIFTLDPPRFIAKYFAIGTDAPAPVIERAMCVWKSVQPQVLSGRAREALKIDARWDLAETKVPLLYLQGKQDHLLTPDCLRQIRNIRADVTVAQVDAPHMVLQRVPQWGASVISKFMGGLQV